MSVQPIESELDDAVQGTGLLEQMGRSGTTAISTGPLNRAAAAVQSQHLEVPTTDYQQCGRTDLFERRPGESGRPPREITSRTWSGTPAAAIVCAAAPVLAPNTTGSRLVSRRSFSHRMAPRREAKRGMSNRYVRVRSSICSSSAVSRSISSVA